MRLHRIACLALVCLLLGGCSVSGLAEAPSGTEPVTQPTTEATEPPPTAPADGDPNNVTAKGSYTGTMASDVPVAAVGDQTLTGAVLQLYYGLTVAHWRESGQTPAPDWSLALDVQECPLEGEAVTWQQFFLQRALDTWHLHTALILQSAEAVMELDPDYEPNLRNHEIYFDDSMPVVSRIYGKDPSYKLNDLNRAFIEELPDLLAQLGGADALAGALGGSGVTGADLEALAVRLNEAYAYFIWARRQAFGEDQEVLSGDTVTFRHVLLIPEDGDWDACEARASALLAEYLGQTKVDEARFAVVANQNSMDLGTRLCGGLYEYVSPGQMADALDAWLFDPSRTPGETALVRSDLGVHILYFSGRDSFPDRSALGEALIAGALEQFPMTVSYGDILLEKTPDPDCVTFRDLLYPDVAHEYITDIPVYLQQDFPTTLYNYSSLAKNGCGITTLAMLATYMSDTWLTPPMLAARYPQYKSSLGTDARIFADTAPELGYFLEASYFNYPETVEALAQGKVTSCLQYPGLFTRQGHYLIMAGHNPDGTISLRDSNIYNYGTIHSHKDDRFTWSQITAKGVMYWIWQDKITRIPSCARCGGETGLAAPEGLLQSDYTCSKCLDALARMEDFLNYFG